jgi:hypothetical protein
MTYRKSFAQSLKPSVPRVKTGVLVSYTGSLATVAIEGQQMTLPMLDSVSTTIAVGSTVVCQVYGNSGFIIGSVNTVSRSASGAWTGGFSNPPVPKPSTQGFGYSNFSPIGLGAYDDTSGTFSAATSSFTQSSTTGGAWFFGASAFSSLSSRTIQSIEVYLPPLTSGSYPLNVAYHLYATRPGGVAGFSGTPVTRSASGWVALPTTWNSVMQSNLTKFGVGISTSTNTAVISNGLPYGTLRIGWSN